MNEYPAPIDEAKFEIEKMALNRRRFTYPEMSGYSVIVEARPNFMKYEVFEGEDEIGSFLDDSYLHCLLNRLDVERAVLTAFMPVL